MLSLSLCFCVALGLFAYVTSLWTGIHKSHGDVIDSIFALGMIKREETVDLMKKFDRYDFLPHAPAESWMNIPVCINYSATMPEGSYVTLRRTTKSKLQLWMDETYEEFMSMNLLLLQHGTSLDAIYKWLKPGARCLDIGSGTGYIAACMAEMVGPTGKVYGVEHIPYIMEQSIEAIRINHADLLDDGILEFVCRDGRAGLHEKGPFDVIHLGGSVVNNPYHLMSQLKPNGCLLAPVGLNYHEQTLRRYIKYNETAFKVDDIAGTVQEPLIPRYEQERQWNEDTAEFNRSFNKLLETLKYKEFKEEKDRKKAEAALREKMQTRSVLDKPLKNPEQYTHVMNDLSAIFPSNETVPYSPRQWDPKNYA